MGETNVSVSTSKIPNNLKDINIPVITKASKK